MTKPFTLQTKHQRRSKFCFLKLLKQNIVHECDDEDGSPTQWSSEINHPKYGKYCWINDMGDYFGVEVEEKK